MTNRLIEKIVKFAIEAAAFIAAFVVSAILSGYVLMVLFGD
jgi:hypothetical protein